MRVRVEKNGTNLPMMFLLPETQAEEQQIRWLDKVITANGVTTLPNAVFGIKFPLHP